MNNYEEIEKDKEDILLDIEDLKNRIKTIAVSINDDDEKSAVIDVCLAEITTLYNILNTI